MTSFPCPNPTCTHRFKAEEVKGAGALQCPRCGAVFHFRREASPARAEPKSRPAPPAVPVARPVGPPPAVPPAGSGLHKPESILPVPEVANPPEPAFPETSRPVVRVRYPRQTSVWKSVTLAIVGLLVAIAAITGFVHFRRKIASQIETPAGASDKFIGQLLNLKSKEEKAFQILAPAGAWQQDEFLRKGLKAAVALQRTETGGDPDTSRAAWVAAAVKDFGFRKPRDAELIKEGIDRLANLFGETLELSEKAQIKELAGNRARALEFKGMVNQVIWRGECFMIARHGIGYWIFVAAPTLQEADAELGELQKNGRGFALTDERRGWREQPPKMDTFRGSTVALSVSAPENVWEKKDPTEVDEHGVLLLYGRHFQDKDNRKNAQVLIVALEKHDDPLKAARVYFEEERRKDNKDYQFEETGSGTVGERNIPYLELKVHLGTQPTRYLLVAAEPTSTKTSAVLCDSTWENRQIWRQDFLDLLGTLELPKQSGTE